MKSIRFLMVMGLLASPGMTQKNQPDTETQQQILDELRAIHRDLRASTTLQLLLADLQLTQTSLDHAIQRRDALKAQVTQLQADEKSAQADVARIQGATEKASDPDLKQQLFGKLEELKDGLRKVTEQEEAKSEQLQDAESRLQTAQAEQEEIQGQLSDLVKKLGPVN